MFFSKFRVKIFETFWHFQKKSCCPKKPEIIHWFHFLTRPPRKQILPKKGPYLPNLTNGKSAWDSGDRHCDGCFDRHNAVLDPPTEMGHCPHKKDVPRKVTAETQCKNIHGGPINWGHLSNEYLRKGPIWDISLISPPGNPLWQIWTWNPLILWVIDIRLKETDSEASRCWNINFYRKNTYVSN